MELLLVIVGYLFIRFFFEEEMWFRVFLRLKAVFVVLRFYFKRVIDRFIWFYCFL